LIDAKWRGLLANGLKILRVQMEIASRSDGKSISQSGAEFVANGLHPAKIKIVLVAGVRSPDNVRDSVRDSIFGHGERILDGACSVV
jgi:hypothetical protein